MSNEHNVPLVLALDDPAATLEQVGGKGASLARLAAAGLPVPPGFHITTAAYRSFVAKNGLQEQIVATASAASADQPDYHIVQKHRITGDATTRVETSHTQREVHTGKRRRVAARTALTALRNARTTSLEQSNDSLCADSRHRYIFR